MSGIIPPTICAYCHEPFTALKPGRKYCSRTCRGKSLTTAQRCAAVQAAAAARRAQSAMRMATRLRGQFGELSEREYRLVSVIAKDAYERGYNAAYHAQFSRRKVA